MSMAVKTGDAGEEWQSILTAHKIHLLGKFSTKIFMKIPPAGKLFLA